MDQVRHDGMLLHDRRTSPNCGPLHSVNDECVKRFHADFPEGNNNNNKNKVRLQPLMM